MITVHHLSDSRSQRVLWLLEELGVAYEVKRYERDPRTMLAPAELRAVHPLGKSPVIEDGPPGDPVIVAETGAIIEYLLETRGGSGLKPPPGSAEARRFTYWLHYAEGSAMTPLLLKLIFSRLPANAPSLLRPIVRGVADRVQKVLVDPQLAAHAAWWEAELARGPWFAGVEFTAADIMMSFPVETGARRIGYGPDKPHLSRFLERIHARPAYRRALERGGEYAYA